MFSIHRDHSALTSLRDLLHRADESTRESILQAARRLDEQLIRDPNAQGESRDGVTRIAFQAPLAVLFEVNENKQEVRIIRAWAFRTGAASRDELE